MKNSVMQLDHGSQICVGQAAIHEQMETETGPSEYVQEDQRDFTNSQRFNPNPTRKTGTKRSSSTIPRNVPGQRRHTIYR